jgi:hypothetical protein
MVWQRGQLLQSILRLIAAIGAIIALIMIFGS